MKLFSTYKRTAAFFAAILTTTVLSIPAFSAVGDTLSDSYFQYEVTDEENLTCKLTGLLNTTVTGTLTIPSLVYDNSNIKQYKVTCIASRAFDGTIMGSATIKIGDNVEIIESYAFNGVKAFTGLLKIPNSVKIIGEYAFYSCTGFESIELGENVESIGNYAFFECSGLKGSLIIPDKVKTIGEKAFYQLNFDGNLTLGKSLENIGESAFAQTKFKGNLILPSNLQTMGTDAFFSCNGFTGSLVIPDEIKTIEEGVFAKCSGFNGTLTLGEGLTQIKAGAFYYCWFTGDLIIPKNIKSIEGEAFYNGKYNNLILQSNTTLGGVSTGRFNKNKVFDSIDFKSITCLSELPPSAGGAEFSNHIYEYADLYVPKNAFSRYSQHSEWKKFSFFHFIVPVSSVTVNSSKNSYKVGETITLTTTVSPSDATKPLDTSWTFSNSIVYPKENNESFIACNKGTVEITAKVTNEVTIGGVEGTTTINIQPSYIEADKTFSAIKAGQTATVKLNVDENLDDTFSYSGFGFKITLPTGVKVKSVTTSESLSNFTTLSSTDKDGNYIVNSYASDAVPSSIKEAFLTLTLEAEKSVKANNLASLKISEVIFTSPEAMDINFDDSEEYTFEIINTPITDEDITVNSSDREDNDNLPDNDETKRDFNEIYVNEKITYTAEVAETVTIKELKWQLIDDTDIVSIKDNGDNSVDVTGQKLGTAKLKAVSEAYPEFSYELTVNVIPMPVTVHIKVLENTDLKNLNVDDEVELIYTLTPDNELLTGKINLAWRATSATNSISVENGKITAKALGDASVILTASYVNTYAADKYKTVPNDQVEVKVVPVPADEVTVTVAPSVTGKDAEVVVGESLELSVAISPDETYTGPVDISWSSADNEVLSVNAGADGKTCTVTAKKYTENKVKVTATITYDTDKVVTGEIEVTILPKAAESVNITAEFLKSCTHTDHIKVGEELQFIAEVLPEITTFKDVEWKVEDPEYASITPDGILTAIKAGTTNVVATVKNTSVTKKFALFITEGIQGDANDNGSVNIADVVAIRNEVLKNEESENANFCHANADIDGANGIEVLDQAAVLNYVLTGSFNATSENTRAANVITGCLTADNFDSQKGKTDISVALDNPSDFIILQADIMIPAGMCVEEIKTGKQADAHNLFYNYIEENILRIVLDSPYNQNFSNSNGSLFSLSVSMDQNCGDLQISNIVAADRNINRRELTFRGGHDDGSTSVSMETEDGFKVMTVQGGITILNGQGKNISIYSIDGKLIKSLNPVKDRETLYLAPGVYAVIKDNQSVKVNVK
ncbi:MAG: leucine-rich repeat protein [Muribaculaceae bacterium]|nr:leucine-rich repeat protein [Muribaculaceae bacterium]